MEATTRPGLILAACVVAVSLAACAGPTAGATDVADPQAPADAAAPAEFSEEAPVVLPPPIEPVLEEPPLAPVVSIACAGPATQGGAIACRTNPGGTILLNDEPVAIADSAGVAIIGLRRDAPKEAHISVRISESELMAETTIQVLPRKDTVSKFTMECGKIAAQTPDQKRHAEVSWLKKDRALKVFAEPVSVFGVSKPAEGPYSSPYGAIRTYVPKTRDCEGTTNVHNGQDIAIATGTEIHAPMGGTVLLADPDLYYEGGAVFLDHGHGLVSVMMHMSRIDVSDGAILQQGDVLGLSGATGRVTGPHLHWAMKFRNVHSDDRSTDIWLDPVLMMDVALPN